MIALVAGENILDVALTPLETFTITTSVGWGAGTISPSIAKVPKGSSQTFIITPATHWRIAHVWIDQQYDAGPVSTFTFRDIYSDHRMMVEFDRVLEVKHG